MTTDKPEVKAWVISADVPYSGFQRHVCMSEDDAHQSRAIFERLMGEVEENLLIGLSDYEALQAECEKLRKDAERYRWLRADALSAYEDDLDEPQLVYARECVGDYQDCIDAAIDEAIAGDNR